MSIFRLTSLVLCNVIGVGALYMPFQLAQFGGSAVLGVLFAGLGSLIWSSLVCNLFYHTKNTKMSSIEECIFIGLQTYLPNQADRVRVYVFIIYWLMSAISNALFVLGILEILGLETSEVLNAGILFLIVIILNCLPIDGYVICGYITICKVILVGTCPVLIHWFGSRSMETISSPAIQATWLCAARLTWSFLGIESAVFLDNVKPYVLWWAISIAVSVCTILYGYNMYVISKVYNSNLITHDKGLPYADMLERCTGWDTSFLHLCINFVVLLTLAGSFYSWIKLDGEMGLRGAKTGILPKVFGICLNDGHNTLYVRPYVSLLFSGLIGFSTIALPRLLLNEYTNITRIQLLEGITTFSALIILLMYLCTVFSSMVLSNSYYNHLLSGLTLLYTILSTIALMEVACISTIIKTLLGSCFLSELIYQIRVLKPAWFVKR